MTESKDGYSDFCVFERGERRFAVSTNLAKEVVTSHSPTPVPEAPEELLGALNLRGEVVPLVSFDALLDIPPRPLSDRDTLLVLSLGDLRIAAVVDCVAPIEQLRSADILHAAATSQGTGPFIRGTLGDREKRVGILDAERLITTIVERITEGFHRTSTSTQYATQPGARLQED